MKTACSKFLILASLLAIAEVAKAQLVNGNFETGDLTGWTPYVDVPGGDLNGPSVVQFDTAGTGSNSLCAQFEVGEIPGNGAGADGYGEGGGIYQYVTLNTGQLTISMNIAAFSLGNNGQAGNYLLFLDGNLVTYQEFGYIGFDQVERSTMSYTGTVTAGLHKIAIDMRRGSGLGVGNTPFQYVDNITLAGSATPEPSVTMLLSLGLAAVALGYQQKQIKQKLSGHLPKRIKP